MKNKNKCKRKNVLRPHARQINCCKTTSKNPRGRIGIEPATENDFSEIKKYLTLKGFVQYAENAIVYNLNSPKNENKILERNHRVQHGDIIQEYGFLSPTIIIIEDYVKFYINRYEQTDPTLSVGSEKREKKLKNIRAGLIAEKVFDAILKNIGLQFNYPEPIRDWRTTDTAPFSQPCDCYIPCLGKVEVKSVTNFDKGRVNIPKPELQNAMPDYVVALWRICGEYVMLCGAMPYERVTNYIDSEYDRPGVNGASDYLSIPLEDFMNSISAGRFYNALIEAKRRTDGLEPIILRSGENNVNTGC
jgi:tRNA(Ser,Leu) C12 N-acetylase TAN1